MLKFIQEGTKPDFGSMTAVILDKVARHWLIETEQLKIGGKNTRRFLCLL